VSVEPTVLLIEDEPQMRRFLRASLDGNGFKLVEASSGSEGRQLAASYNPELILLDLGLPDCDGVALTRELRGWARMPIIVISARGREANKVEALDAGADDYLTKPFGVNELLARMRVALRHAASAGERRETQLRFGSVQLDLIRRVVTRDGVEVHLTPNEYRLFTVLAQHAGKVLTHGHLLKEVWGPGASQQTHYLRVYMGQLRQKLEEDPARPKLLVTEPGVGYRLKEPLPS
jgi:two-component system KDP operon response regulator KdpE